MKQNSLKIILVFVTFVVSQNSILSQCEISEVFAEAHDCNGDGQFLVDVEFSFSNTGSQGFSIVGNGNNYGSFNYGQTFYTIGPIDGDGTTSYEFIIQDNQFPDCSSFYVIDPVNCGNGDCQISDLGLDVGDCNNDGNYSFALNFNYENTPNEFFDVIYLGQVIGFFNLNDLPVTIENFDDNEASVAVIEICINDSDCCFENSFETPNCTSTDCEIWDLSFETGECDDQGNYNLVINFNYANSPNEFFDVFYGDENIGFFELANLPIAIENFEDNGEAFPVITVCINDTPNCCAENEFEAPECGGGEECEIWDVIAEAHECDDNGQFLVDIAFSYLNVGNDGFVILGNGNNYGSFDYGAESYTIGPLNSDGISELEFLVFDNQSDGCFGEVVMETPDCGSANFVWPGDANSDNLVDNFDVLNLGLTFGQEGFQRDAQTIEWGGFMAESWAGQFENEVNYKHADCNGNGGVNWSDLEAVAQNYDLSHGFVEAFIPVEGTEVDPIFFVDLPGAEPIIAGQPFNAPIILGDTDILMTDLYGIAFTIKFDKEVIDPSSVEITFDNSWIGTNEVNVMTLQKNWSEMGEIDVIITKIDQNNVSGFGEIAGFIGVIDDLVGKELMEIEITNVKAISKNETILPLRTPIILGEVVSSNDNVSPNNKVSIFPNPANELLNIGNDFELAIDKLTIKNMEGKTLYSMQNAKNQLDTSNLNAGVYLLEIEIGYKRFYEKLIKI